MHGVRPSPLDMNVDDFSCRHRGSLVPKQVVSQEGSRINKRCVKCKVVMHASIEFVLGLRVLQAAAHHAGSLSI